MEDLWMKKVSDTFWSSSLTSRHSIAIGLKKKVCWDWWVSDKEEEPHMYSALIPHKDFGVNEPAVDGFDTKEDAAKDIEKAIDRTVRFEGEDNEDDEG